MSKIPDTARAALLVIADWLRDGFTGEIVVQCKDGGVRHVDCTQRHYPGSQPVDTGSGKKEKTGTDGNN